MVYVCCINITKEIGDDSYPKDSAVCVENNLVLGMATSCCVVPVIVIFDTKGRQFGTKEDENNLLLEDKYNKKSKVLQEWKNENIIKQKRIQTWDLYDTNTYIECDNDILPKKR